MDLLRRIPARLRANDPEPESYETKVRVLSLMCLCILSVAPITAITYMSIERPPSPLPAGYFLLLAALFLWPFSWLAVFVWAFAVGRTTAVMMDCLIGGSLFASALAAVGSPEFDVSYVSMTLFAGTCVIVGTTWWKAWYILSHVVGLLQAYNRLALHTGWTLAAIDPLRLEDINTISYAISTFGFGTAAVMLCATLLLQHFEQMRAKSAAVAAEEVTATIAVKLQAYDTTAAAEALKHEAASGVDTELKVAFTALVANLESYRPYLPNWLLCSTDEDAEAAGPNDDESAADSTSDISELSEVASHQCGSPKLTRTHSKSRSGAFARSTGSQGVGELPPIEKPGSEGNGSAVFEKRSRSTPGGSPRVSAHSSPLHRHGSNTSESSARALEKRSYLKGTVTFAVIEYVTEDVPDAALSETLTAVADAVHQCAAECKGAVHTMLLGEIVVSWNVATRVAGPEAKAAKFLITLKSALAESRDIHPSLKAVAVSSTHQGRSEAIGTGKKLLTSERTGSLRHKLRGILKFAWSAHGSQASHGPDLSFSGAITQVSPLSVVLLDDRTMRGASSNFIISAGAVLDLSAQLPARKVKPGGAAGQGASDMQTSLDSSRIDQFNQTNPKRDDQLSVLMSSLRRADGSAPLPPSPPHSPTLPTLSRISMDSVANGNGKVRNGTTNVPQRPQPLIQDSPVRGAPPRGVSFSSSQLEEATTPAEPPTGGSRGPSVVHDTSRAFTQVSTLQKTGSVSLLKTSPLLAGRRMPFKAVVEQVLANTQMSRSGGRTHGLVHVFDLVCPRTGGDDEWLYAMEEGAADAARAAQLMVGAGLRRQSGGVDAAAVRAAFEEAGKQRDGAVIMARPLVRQMIEGLHLLPVHV